LPTVIVDLLDSKVTLRQRRLLAWSLTKVVSETLGYPNERVTIVLKGASKRNIARGGKLGG
jgi:phenylpyruvate tautomerase PptA (4-oxalocrotonate tautomerase family)